MAIALLPVISRIAGALSIPAAAMFFGNLAAQMIAWFAAKVTKQAAINLTIIILVIGLAASVAAGIYALLAGISYLTPPFLSDAFSFFVPNNAIPCFSACVSARFIRWVWEWQVYSIMKVAGV
ncbi:DUF5455 family protein [Vibrio sp. S4M6]|uniref:DUF5455 family protein n=1 Tax=Vibrio sinus TaxID=2946865 RepID=UPI00202A29A4|nr:DUF5455 family protein [Vibrio sinus]MCL9783238.1 DUF5455 family protein [Vibrio sinus]